MRYNDSAQGITERDLQTRWGFAVIVRFWHPTCFAVRRCSVRVLAPGRGIPSTIPVRESPPMNKSRLFLAVCAAAFAGSAFAGPSPQSANFQVTATVASSCTVTATNIAFGAYDPADTNATVARDANGSVNVRCTRGTSTAVAALNQGLNAATGSTCANPLRQMAGAGTERLRYDIYQDAGRATAWGCAAANTQAIP